MSDRLLESPPTNERSAPRPWDAGAWSRELAEAFRRPQELLSFLEVDAPTSTEAESDFAFLVPRPFAQRMRKGDPEDPLLRQVLPVSEETVDEPGFSPDALGETIPELSKGPGLLQKYRGRALLLAAGACAVNCRYCFRRSFPYEDHRSGPESRLALDSIRRDPGLNEVILSGGDPLLLKDESLAALLDEIADIPHVRRVRVHSRLPIVLPQRTTAALLDAVGRSPLQIVVVAHANHPRELSEDTDRGFRLLREAGATLLNQSVLLSRVNDDVAVLEELSERLFDQGVLPYYLHLLDRVTGTGHFEVSESRARALHEQLQGRLPGFLVPRLVREVPGEASKIVLGR